MPRLSAWVAKVWRQRWAWASAMVAGIAFHQWEVMEIVALIEARSQ